MEKADHNLIQCNKLSGSPSTSSHCISTEPSPLEDHPVISSPLFFNLIPVLSVFYPIMDFITTLGLNIIPAPANSQLAASRSHSSDSADLLNEYPLLWFANINNEGLDESSPRWLEILDKLSEEEHKKVTRFIHHQDRKRALLSILLQRAAIHETFQFRHPDEYQIRRTKENKPFLVNTTGLSGRWNYNVSHHGDFVGIVTHHHALVGIDIVDTATRSQGIRSSREYVEMFSAQLTSLELDSILSEPDDNSRYDMFFLHWSLKEAFIKAIGQGLGYNLRQIEFTVIPAEDDCSQRGGRKIFRGSATVSIKGIRRDDWRFEYFALDDRHVATISEGPCHEALPTFQEAAWGKVIRPPVTTTFVPSGNEMVSTVAAKMLLSKTEYLHVDDALKILHFDHLYDKVFPDAFTTF